MSVVSSARLWLVRGGAWFRSSVPRVGGVLEHSSSIEQLEYCFQRRTWCMVYLSKVHIGTPVTGDRSQYSMIILDSADGIRDSPSRVTTFLSPPGSFGFGLVFLFCFVLRCACRTQALYRSSRLRWRSLIWSLSIAFTQLSLICIRRLKRLELSPLAINSNGEINRVWNTVCVMDCWHHPEILVVPDWR